MSNAFKHTEEKGEIHVSLTFDEDNFRITVKDTGAGIAQEEIEHIFERYYQSTTIKNKSGVGIGLSLTKNFIELHNGQIKIESQLKKGSTFSVLIPRDKKLFIK